MILLDTDVCIELLRGNKKVIRKRSSISEYPVISFMSVGELYYGIEKSGSPEKNRSLLDQFLISIFVIYPDHEIMVLFGKLKAYLSNEKKLLPDADILIASTALKRCSKLITGNINHFKRFPDLTIENWLH